MSKPLYWIYRSKQEGLGILWAQLIDNKYFSRNPFAMNILQPLPPCKPLNTITLHPKYPVGGVGHLSEMNRETYGHSNPRHKTHHKLESDASLPQLANVHR